MKNKLKVETYTIKGWKDSVRGLLISENKDWILVHHLPMDYELDGYKLYRKTFVKKRKSKRSEALVKRVLKLRNTSIKHPEGFKFNNVAKTLKWCEKKYDLFEFQDHKQSHLFYGKINNLDKKQLIIDSINTRGEIEEAFDYTFNLDKIRSITFETDYFEAIRLMLYEGLTSKN